MSETQALEKSETQTNGNGVAVIDPVANERAAFELAQRKAAIYAQSSLVPDTYRGNIGNVLIAENMARRMGADTLMVMQNLYVVHGKPGWSATFLIASFNSNGKFSAIKYRFRGEEHTPEWGCQAYCNELATGEEISGTWVTWDMANKENWVNKAGSKWKTMPEQMFRYRAATFLIRATAPEIGMGLLTRDEIEDTHAGTKDDIPAQKGIGGLKDRLGDLGLIEDGAENIQDAEIVNETPNPSIHERPDDTDEAAEASADEAEADGIDPLESLRANVQAALDPLMKDQQKAILNGRKVKDMGVDELNQVLIDTRKA